MLFAALPVVCSQSQPCVAVPEEALESTALSSLCRLNTFNRLFFLSFFPSFSDPASLAAAATAGSAPLASSTPASTPNTFMVNPHSSRNFFSSSAVSVPGRPGGVFGAMTRYESVRSFTSNCVAQSCRVMSLSGDFCTRGIRSAPPTAMPKTITTVQLALLLFWYIGVDLHSEWYFLLAQKLGL
jgi:hypothetical protein